MPCRCSQGLADRADDGPHLPDGRRLAGGHAPPQVAPLDILHHEIGPALYGPEIVDREDVRVRHAGHQLRFAAEPIQALARPATALQREELHGDQPAKGVLARGVNLAHAPLADTPAQLVSGDDWGRAP
jgi:hypothetical protein